MIDGDRLRPHGMIGACKSHAGNVAVDIVLGGVSQAQNRAHTAHIHGRLSTNVGDTAVRLEQRIRNIAPGRAGFDVVPDLCFHPAQTRQRAKLHITALHQVA